MVTNANIRGITAKKTLVALSNLTREYAYEIEKQNSEVKSLKKEIEVLGHPGFLALNVIPIFGSIAHIGILTAVIVKES